MPEQRPHVAERDKTMTVGIVSGRGRAGDQLERSKKPLLSRMRVKTHPVSLSTANPQGLQPQ
jgi:hypothetical protein